MDLRTDTTIAEVVGRLNKPAEYVRRVLEHMWDCKRQHGAASVRIGIMGAGRAPNYRIEYHKESMLRPAVFSVHNGLSHKDIDGLGQWNFSVGELLEGKPIQEKPPEHHLDDAHWSSKVMTLDEVSVLLGQLRSSRH